MSSSASPLCRSKSGCAPSDVPEEGVSWEALEQFTKENNIDGLSVDDVCEQLIKPSTSSLRVAYSEFFKRKDARFVGRANVFVSHAWLCKMTDLLSALKKWLDDRQGAERAQSWFFWIDVFVCNQEASVPKEFDWWKETFRQSVERIGRTVIVMTPWKTPTYIERAWCLFEFYITLNCKIPYDLTMSEKDQDMFNAELMEGKDVISHILKIDISLASAKFQTDKDNIMKCMEDLEGGRERVNAIILKEIKIWVQKQMTAALATMSEKERVLSNVQLQVAQNSYAIFKKSAEGGRMIQESCEARRREYGDEDDKTLHAMKYLAAYHQHENQHTESVRLYQTICDVRQKKLAASQESFVTDQINHLIAKRKRYEFMKETPDSPRMQHPSQDLLHQADNEFTDLLKIDRLKPNQKIRCLSEKARVLVLLGRFQEAADLFAESSRLGKHNKSAMNGATLRMNRDWGDCLTQLGMFEEGEKMLRQSFDDSKKLYGDIHEETNMARNFLARNLRAQLRDSEASDIERVKSWSKRLHGLGGSTDTKRKRDDESK